MKAQIRKSKIYVILKRSNFLKSVIYTISKLLNDKDYRLALRRFWLYKAKSFTTIRKEMKACKAYWNCPPSYYIRYGLQEKNLPLDEILDYIPPYYFYNFYLPQRLDDINTNHWSNKLEQYNLFQKRGICTPLIVGLVKNGNISVDNNTVSYQEFIANYSDYLKKGGKLFFKPTDGKGGAGIIVLKQNDEFLYANKTIINTYDELGSLLESNKTYLIQEKIIQRRDFNDINDSSVNTLRVITQNKDGKIIIAVCVIRMGRNNSDVDNSCQGGISVRIDCNDGTFNSKAFSEHGGDQFETHPNSEFVFKNKKLLGWNEIKSTIVEYAILLPEFKELAWDVAILETGVSIIEINFIYALDLMQCCSGGLRKSLGVYPKGESFFLNG